MASQLSRMKTWSKSALAVIPLVLSGFVTEAALAASEDSSAPSSLLDSKFTMALGGFFPRVKSTLTLTSASGGGTEIDGEDDLGIDNNTASAWLSFNWRFQPRHQLQVEWFQLNRSGSTSASTSFEIFDTVIGVGASLDSKLDLNLGRLTYAYSILRKENLDLSFQVGAHVATLKATVTASGNVTVNGMMLGSGR